MESKQQERKRLNAMIDRILNDPGHDAFGQLYDLVMAEIKPVIVALIAELVATKQVNKALERQIEELKRKGSDAD